MAEETITRQIQEHAQPVSIELERGQKGTYAWSLKVRGTTVRECLSLIYEADGSLRAGYCGAEPQK